MLKAIDESFGIMKRDETPEETVRQMKEASSQMWERRREYLDSIG